nr:uncharacterized protein LOC127347146 [Lolium perenne]
MVASGGGGIGGDGQGGAGPWPVAAFTLVLFGPELFGLARTAFGFTADPAPGTAPAPSCGSRCVPARHLFTAVVDETAGVTGVGAVAGIVGGAAEAPATTGEGVGAGAVATAAGGVSTAAGGVDSRLIGDKSEGGGAEEARAHRSAAAAVGTS